MPIRQLACILLSGISYATALLFIDTCWWSILLFPAPLIIALRATAHPFAVGCLWALCALVPVLSGLAVALFILMSAHSAIALISSAALIIYFILLTGCLAVFTHYAQKQVRNPLHILLFWSTALTLFFQFVDVGSLWMLDGWQGLFFLDPLMPLTMSAVWAHLLPYTGKFLLLLIFFISSLTPLFLFEANRWLGVGTAAIIALALCCRPTRSPHTRECSGIAILPMVHRTTNSTRCAHMIVQQCINIIKNNPHITCIIMPESAVQSDNELPVEELARQLARTDQLASVHLIFGALWQHNNQDFNTLYWLHNGVVKAAYHKQHAVPLVERLPGWLVYVIAYFNYRYPHHLVTTIDVQRPLLAIWQDLHFVPYICSELLCAHVPLDDHQTVPILALCNDNWTHFFYLKRLMSAAARLKAIGWQRDILYVAYAEVVYIQADGSVVYLN